MLLFVFVFVFVLFVLLRIADVFAWLVSLAFIELPQRTKGRFFFGGCCCEVCASGTVSFAPAMVWTAAAAAATMGGTIPETPTALPFAAAGSLWLAVLVSD